MSVYSVWVLIQQIIRDEKPGLAPKTFGAVLRLRFAQNDK